MIFFKVLIPLLWEGIRNLGLRAQSRITTEASSRRRRNILDIFTLLKMLLSVI